MWKAALFDLDGVVFDTEPQYSVFWGCECRRYHPEQPGLENRIKGQTLPHILDDCLCISKEEQRSLIERLDAFESQMSYDYVKDFEKFIISLREKDIKTAVVTSSNIAKMNSVYRQRPELHTYFDAILTSEDFAESKPSPDCYLRAAGRFDAEPTECVVFEDSFNGLKAGRAAGMLVVGLSTTNLESQIAPYADLVIPDYGESDLLFKNINSHCETKIHN